MDDIKTVGKRTGKSVKRFFEGTKGAQKWLKEGWKTTNGVKNATKAYLPGRKELNSMTSRAITEKDAMLRKLMG